MDRIFLLRIATDREVVDFKQRYLFRCCHHVHYPISLGKKLCHRRAPATLLSLTLLKRVLESAGDGILVSMVRVLFLLAAILAVGAETLSFPKDDIVYPPIVAYVILSFLGQAVFGMALLRTGLLPAWVGWVTVAWSLVMLIFLIVAKPQDMYYPWLHYIALLRNG
jgi:hypothetical protein